MGAKEIDEDAVDEDRVVYQGIDSVLGIRIHRDSSQILNVLQQQATYELKKGEPLVINKNFLIISYLQYLILKLYFNKNIHFISIIFNYKESTDIHNESEKYETRQLATVKFRVSMSCRCQPF